MGMRAQAQVTRQERALQKTANQLAQMEKAHERMVAQYEAALAELERLRQQVAQDVSGQMANMEIQPPLGTAMPQGINSQYDKFINKTSNSRLRSTTQGNIRPGEPFGLQAGENAIHTGTSSASTLRGHIPTGDTPLGSPPGGVDATYAQKLPTEDTTDVPMYRSADMDNHYDAVRNSNGEPLYVSGYYSKSGSTSKTYEYLLWPTAIPISVGQTVRAPVHPVGYHQGRRTGPGHDLDFVVTDIYTKEKFRPYHDMIR